MPKNAAASSSQADASRRKAKRRQAAIFSDDDENGSAAGGSEAARSAKRARTDEGSVGGMSVGDPEVDAVVEEEVKIEDEEPNEEDTRFLPPSKPVRRGSSAASGGRSRARSASTKKGASKKKRAVVMSDDDVEDDYEEPLDAGAMYDSEDEDFEPEPSHSKKKAKTRSTRRDSRGPDREVTVKDERSSVPPPAGATEDEETVDIESIAKEPTPPPKKRKFPPIKKIKVPAPAGSTAGSTPTSKPAGKGTEDAFALPGGARKPAATINNADFDLRDASVYASLFNKPGGSTPNSGLNRKEKEEERKRELNKMREDARAKRAEEVKSTFDLQAASEKMARFDEKLKARRSIAVYPNILGAAIRDVVDRKKKREREAASWH